MANYGDKGWIALWRSNFHNPLYNEEPFDKWHALMDLCMMADDQGTVRTSLKALKIRWFWGSTHKVRDYLESVQGMGWGTVTSTPNKGTLIRLNTDFFTVKKTTKKRSKGTVKGTVKGTEELLLKEVGMASLEVSQPSKEKSYAELMEEIDDEYQ